MVAGRVGSWEKMQLRVRIEPDLLNTDNAGASGILTAPFAIDTDAETNFLRMVLSIRRDPTLGWRLRAEVELRIGSLVYAWDDEVASSPTAHELVLEWLAPRWYVSPLPDETPAWEFRWQGINIYRDGFPVPHTLPNTGAVRNDLYFAPAGLPMAMTRLDAQVQTGDAIVTGNPANPCNSWSSVARAFVRVTGGWRIWEHDADDWTVYPIRIPTTAWHGDPCNNLSEQRPELDGTNTWNATVSRHEEYSVYHTYLGLLECLCYCGDALNGSVTYRVFKRTTTDKNHSASVWIVPDLPKRMVVIGETIPHEYLMYRHSFPSVGVLRYWSGVHTEIRCPLPDPITICRQNNFDNPETVVLHNARDPLLWVHDGDTDNPLNEPTAEPTYCPYTAGVTAAVYEETFSCLVDPTNPGLCPLCPIEGDYPPPPGFPCCTFDGTGTVGRTRVYSETHTWVVNDNCHPYYRHSNPAARYFNTHASPYWNYICWLQNWRLDRDGDGVAEPTPVADYWRPHQCQHIEHPALPESVRSRRRSYLLLDTLAHGTWSEWIGDLFGIPSGWVGSVRPALVPILQHGQLQLRDDCRSRWSATNATLSFGATGITVTPTDTTHTLTFTLADFRDPPFLYPAVADKIVVNYPSEAYSSLTIELVSVEGETTTIATSGGEHPIPYGSDSNYAGTWARRYEALLADYTEQGVDTDATRGRSAQTFATPARALLWLLLNARAGETIRFTVGQSAPTPYTLPYPVFKRDAIVRFATDNGAHTNPVIYGNQTLNWGVFRYPLATNTPSVRSPHEPMTLYDACALYEQLELGRTGESTTEIVKRAEAWGFDGLEFYGSPAILRRRSRAVLMPYVSRHVLWVQNDWRECPPLPTLPWRRLRFEPNFGFTGDWGQWVYWAAPSRRYYLTPATDMELIEDPPPTGTVWTTTDRVIGRFRIYAHARAVDGTETMHHPSRRWFLRWREPDTGGSEDRFARLTPFFSHAWVYTTRRPDQPEETRTPIDALNEQRAVSLMLGAQHIVIRYPEQTTVAYMTPYSEWLDIKSVPIVHGYIGIARTESGLVVVLFVENEYQEGIVLNGKYAVLGYRGETREVRVWYNAGDDDDIFTRVSRDWGISFEPAVPCVRDGGTPLRGVPLDATLALIQHAFYLVVREGENHRVLSSEDGVDWTTVLTL